MYSCYFQAIDILRNLKSLTSFSKKNIVKINNLFRLLYKKQFSHKIYDNLPLDNKNFK